ncbi:DUF4296 domain-containing protein [Pedobacter gandavensis]|uniref:DUF4296 domain-containing protein n=1 Tax=Pedobacter TaxID=84567 RepID=UPI001C993C23|nr:MULTISPECIES: DUF4296 domain-containing protein [Pedobacter]WGQ11601.1 DUF4296 domain-containing protein [Pedobacter gandavensis]
MRNFLYILSFFLLFSACKPGIPKDIIQPDIMPDVLSDIHVVDGYVSAIPVLDSAKKVASSFYKGIYTKYGIDSAVLAKSMTYYNNNPQLLADIYTKVVDDLSKQKDVITKADSLKNEKNKLELQLKLSADSIAKKSPDYKIRFLLKDTTSLQDTTKKAMEFIQPKMVFKYPN